MWGLVFGCIRFGVKGSGGQVLRVRSTHYSRALGSNVYRFHAQDWQSEGRELRFCRTVKPNMSYSLLGLRKRDIQNHVVLMAFVSQGRKTCPKP